MLYFTDGDSMQYNDFTIKSSLDLLKKPDVEDQFCFLYPTVWGVQTDAGRIRNETFFKKIYGASKAQVIKNLKEVIWCPKLVNQKILISRVNGIDEIVKKLSEELDQHPEFAEYLKRPGGTFNWRNISGTDNLSSHSFGIALDINVSHSNYWQWDCKCHDEHASLRYKNKIPEKLVRIFEKYGFIWGGRWKHYDTMHFEYRPELLYLSSHH